MTSATFLTPALRDVLTAGLRAPSAENKHHLRFRMLRAGDDHGDGACIELLTTDRSTWDDQPHRRPLALMAYGALLENVRLAASQHGLMASSELPARMGDDDRIAVVTFRTAGPTDGVGTADPTERSLSDAIERRHTNRRFFKRQAVPGERLSAMREATRAVHGADLLWLDTPHKRTLALKAIRLAETERFRRPLLHAELFGAVRFDAGWRTATDEWLPPGALEVELPSRPSFAALRHWRVMRAATLAGAHLALGVRAGWAPARSAPHLGLIVVQDTGLASDWIDAGAALERCWLASDGYAFQPMAASVALSQQKPGAGWVSPQVHRSLNSLLDQLKGGPAVRAAMIFRLGSAAPASMRTGRRAPETYFVVD